MKREGLFCALQPTAKIASAMNKPVLVQGLHSKLVVTTALILTFSPGEKGQRLHASLYAIMRRANPDMV